ncbi:hypothetical protein BG000_007951 [Podila horticola]|nr:hypothetical protein BG000_007951 [Podila horticola]
MRPKGPFRMDGTYWDLHLVYGPGAPDQDPQFGILISESGHFAVDLRSVNGSNLSYTRISDSIFVTENLKTTKPPTLCGESCEFGKRIKLLIIIVSIVVVLFVIGLCLRFSGTTPSGRGGCERGPQGR